MSMELIGMERILYNLKRKFASYGYNEYKMNKFEEYDLYVKNKDFLISDNVITFTDTNGKLLALKPDVTLSIIKNTKSSDGLRKVFYDENVYRVSSKSNGYKEIPQIGLECIGELSDYNVAEVITLAKESLSEISCAYVLDVSPVGIIYNLVEGLNLNKADKTAVYKLINEKNTHELVCLLEDNNIDNELITTISKLTNIYGTIDEVKEELYKLFNGTSAEKLLNEFINIISVVGDGKHVKVDCSSCENVKYYNEITFKGYVNGVPKAVLSGGRYDGLLKIMGKNCGAIGFAIYPDEFDRLFIEQREFDVDVVLLYSDKTDVTTILQFIKNLTATGKTVTALKKLPTNVTYKEIIEI